MQFFTNSKDKLHSFNRIDHITKRFHGENSIMSGLFSKNNLLLCGMQGNNGLLAKTFKKFSKITYTASLFLLLTRAKFAVRSVDYLNNTIENLLFYSFFNGFITLCM